MTILNREHGNQSLLGVSTDHEDRLVDSAIAGLRNALNESKSHRLVLVCDPAIADKLKSQIAELGLPTCQVPIPKSLNSPHPPYLVEVDDERRQEQFVNASLRVAVEEAVRPAPAERRARSVCAWLLTPEPIGAIAHAFNQRLRVCDDAAKPRMLRFWDPRVTQHMTTLFPGCPARSWLPQAAWGYIDANARWVLLPPREWSDNRPPQPSWSVLQHLSLVNEVQQQLAASGTLQPSNTLKAIESALRLAAEVGLSRPEDQVHFAVQRVRLGVAIERAPLIREAIDEVTLLGGRFQKIAQTFDDNDWAVIAQSATALKQDKEPSHEA